MTIQRWGTCHFVSKRAAARYYANYNPEKAVDTAFIDRKIREGLIAIGLPITRPKDKLFLLDGGTRYGIERLT